MSIRSLTGEQLSHRLHETGIARAKAEAKYVYHDETRKIILEGIALDLQEAAETKLSDSKAKSQARISSVFKEAVDGLVLAVEEKFIAYANYKECDFEIKRRINNAFAKSREYNSGKLVP